MHLGLKHTKAAIARYSVSCTTLILQGEKEALELGLGKRPNVKDRQLILKVLKYQRKPLTLAEILWRIKENLCVPVSESREQTIRNILYYEAGRPNGLFLKINGGFELRAKAERRIKKRIWSELNSLGFHVGGGIITPNLSTKADIRKFHTPARREKYEENEVFLNEKEDRLLKHFADGKEIDIKNLWPRLEVVEGGTESSDLFRYATFLWSVPVSRGFGRRVRFLVWDEHTDKLIGLFALGDPVFNLNCRDDWVKWTHHDRANRLYNVMDVFVLGAVPPYNILLGGKLIAMLAASNEVQEVIHKRYKGTKTVIQEKVKDPTLALLTTGSALGKSALYDRIRYNERVLYQKIGESKGWGHFHLNHGLFEDLKEYLDATVQGKSSNRFGAGPNWKIRTARHALKHLGLSGNLLRHGIRREIYAVPLGSNFREFLRGETLKLKKFDQSFDDLVEYWRNRWLAGRAKRKPEFRRFKRETISERIRPAEKEPGGQHHGGR